MASAGTVPVRALHRIDQVNALNKLLSDIRQTLDATQNCCEARRNADRRIRNLTETERI
ncbi:hypothetical protein GA0070216_13121 [Micromonospora matsumotoense]|uniref:Uncharacterized protein n=1 Tax=Micromonospora matsumotoense TaxID=121616 RepID=A0A1C5AVK1_9ACTN|nr:hypothetical protein [Micromonospora matsumotoense]SCF49064.1 hypothetical protein GA0070216_13121 [Micromonospora matsumotoense]